MIIADRLKFRSCRLYLKPINIRDQDGNARQFSFDLTLWNTIPLPPDRDSSHRMLVFDNSNLRKVSGRSSQADQT
jgi:hypothetical protein